jgi:hypothetical protein
MSWFRALKCIFSTFTLIGKGLMHCPRLFTEQSSFFVAACHAIPLKYLDVFVWFKWPGNTELKVTPVNRVYFHSDCKLLTFWRPNYVFFFFFFILCVLNINNIVTKYFRIIKKTAF